MIAISAGDVFDGICACGARTILMDAGRIVAVADRAPAGVPIEPLPEGVVLAPGFVDLQVNGGGGVLFNDAPTPEGLRHIAATHARFGTTGVVPTLVSAPAPLRRTAIAAVRDAMGHDMPGICGLHIEGPFLAPARRGIHPAAHLVAPSADDLAELRAASLPGLMITVAPEIVPPSAIAALAAAGIAVFLGHSDASVAEATAALNAGARGFTHLFNAMSQLVGRTPGMVGAALDSERACAGIIADGVHVHPAAIRLAFRVLGPERLFWVSDAMPSVGDEPAGGFMLNGRRIRLADGRLTDETGTLAGAHLTMAEAVRCAVHLVGLARDDALRMATATPAAQLGLADRGRIRPGARGDLVALDAGLRVVAVWQAGARIV